MSSVTQEDIDDKIIGASDGTPIGNIGDALKVTGVGGTNTEQLITCPDIDSHDNSNIPLPSLPIGYGDIYSYTGGGVFYQYLVGLDSDRVYIALEIDGFTCAEIWVRPLQSMISDEGLKTFGMIFYDEDRRTLGFKPTHPIAFSSSFKIVGKADSNTSSRDITEYQVILRKDS